MRKTLLMVAVAASVGSASATVIMNADFEGITPTNYPSTANHNVGTQLSLRNAGTSGGVEATAPAGFTSAVGQVLRVDDYSGAVDGMALSMFNNAAYDLTSIPGFGTNATYTFSMDIYIPADLSDAIGDIQLRFKDGVNTGNGNGVLGSANIQNAGLYNLSFSGTIGELVNFVPTSTQFFMSIDQDSSTGSGGTLFYVDNVSYEITAIPEPATIGLVAAFGGAVVFVRRLFVL